MHIPPATPEDARQHSQRFLRCLLLTAGFTALLWLVKVIELISGASFVEYGVYPGRVSGLPGIVLGPLIHGSFPHLFANTPPLLILGTALLYGYPRSARIVIPVIYLGVGLCVWLFGRDAWHIGASGLAFGFMFFVFAIGVIRWDRKAIALSMIAFFLYGGMIVGIFPGKPGISFESHLSGALIGLVLAVLLRSTDPRPPPKKYSWDYEEDVDDWAANEPTDFNQQELAPGRVPYHGLKDRSLAQGQNGAREKPDAQQPGS